MPASVRRRPRASLLIATVALTMLAAWPARAELTVPPAAVPGPPPASWPAPVPIEAPAWALVEGATGQILAGEQVEVRRPVASTVKILTALTVLERTALDEQVEVGPEVLGVGGALLGLEPGDVWSVEQLLDGLLARSGNDAAEALAAYVAGSTERFVELMRADARRLGLDGITVTSPSGLDDGNRLSVADLATIARAALAHPDLRPLLARATVTLPGVGEVDTRNELLTTYPGATGLKTGFTVAAGHSLVASAQREGRELVAVVLGAGADPARFDAASALLDHGFERLEPQLVDGRLELAVGGGTVGVTVAPVPVTVPVGRSARVAFTVPTRPDEPVPAAHLLVDGEVLASLDAAADGAVPDRQGGTPADLGLVLVDGVYTALRASTATGVLR